MFKAGIHKVVFSFEPADRSVGIMSEDFSAWLGDDNTVPWCHLTDIAKKTFAWYDNDGESILPPPYHKTVETLLLAYAESFYDRDC